MLWEFHFPEKEELKLRLKDMLENQVDEKYYLSDKGIKYVEKRDGGYTQIATEQTEIAHCPITAKGNDNWTGNFIKQVGILDIKGQDCIKRVYSDDGLSPTLTDMQGGNRQPKIIASTQTHASIRDDGISPTLTTAMGLGGGQIPMIQEPKILIKNNTQQGYLEAHEGDEVYTNISTKRGTVSPQISHTLTSFQDSGVVVKTKNKRILKLAERLPKDKGTYFMDIYNQKILKNETATLKAGMDWQQGNIVSNELRIRKLTPKECWRLMGFHDDEFERAAAHNSNSQLYKQARKLHRC